MSRRLAALNFALRRFGRPLLKRTKTPQRARRDFDLMARLLFRGVKSASSPVTLGGIPGIQVVPSGAPAKQVLLYFHGGGYITGSPRTHLAMIGHLAHACGIRAVLPDYRLAPEAAFPAAFEDAVAVWQAVRSEGILPGDILLGGDSAGGGLALALLAHVLSRRECPAGLFAFSAWTDMTLSGDSMVENADRDPILPVERIEELRAIVAPNADLADPRLSPLFADFGGAPPIYLQASRTEILRDDTIRLADKLRGAGVDVRTDLWPDAPHVWQMFLRWVPEADDALGRVAEFARQRLRSSTPRSGS